jgi:hypothetical protein
MGTLPQEWESLVATKNVNNVTTTVSSTGLDSDNYAYRVYTPSSAGSSDTAQWVLGDVYINDFSYNNYWEYIGRYNTWRYTKH